MVSKIKGWAKFQHFKDRRPPWIKLYRDLLEDPDWHDLDGDTAKTLVALWLIASEDEGQSGALPDARRLAFRLRISETKVNQQLTKLSHWLYHDDIKPLSGGYQDDAPETETETETDIGTDVPIVGTKMPTCPHQKILDLFAKHLPELPQPKPELWNGKNSEALKARWRWVLTAKRKNGTRYAQSQTEAIEWFDRFFGYVAGSDFLSGRSGKWISCDLGWLLKESNFAKVVQGNYENQKVAA